MKNVNQQGLVTSKKEEISNSLYKKIYIRGSKKLDQEVDNK